MQQTSDIYNELLKDASSRKEIKAEIADVNYGEDKVVSMRTYGGMYGSKSTLSVGNAPAREIDLILKDAGEIPRMAKIIPFIRLTNGALYSEWIQKGVFYIDTRKPDNVFGTLTIHGFDDMLKAENIWTPDQSLEFPMSFRAAALEIARIMSVELENPENIDGGSKLVDYPANDYTLRNVLQFIAGAHGGNFIMTDSGRLRLVGFADIPPETYYLVSEVGERITFGGVRILV